MLYGMKESELENVNLMEILHLTIEIRDFLNNCNQNGMIENALLSSLIKSKFEEHAKRVDLMRVQLFRGGNANGSMVPEEKQPNVFQYVDQIGMHLID